MKKEPAVYTPDNEPYLGRMTVLTFDNAIIASMAANAHIAPYTYKIEKSDLQLAACQIIPQGFSIALAIRELVRQGYLFGASVLMRSLVERAVTIMYLYENPDKVAVWTGGWKHKERPNLVQMLNSIGKDKFPHVGFALTSLYNSLTHGDPDSANWNLVVEDGRSGYSVSKITDNPFLCDKVCMEASGWLMVLTSMAITILPPSTD